MAKRGLVRDDSPPGLEEIERAFSFMGSSSATRRLVSRLGFSVVDGIYAVELHLGPFKLVYNRVGGSTGGDRHVSLDVRGEELCIFSRQDKLYPKTLINSSPPPSQFAYLEWTNGPWWTDLLREVRAFVGRVDGELEAQEQARKQRAVASEGEERARREARAAALAKVYRPQSEGE